MLHRLEQIDTNELIDIEGAWFQGIIPRSDGGVWIYAKMPGKSSNMVDGPIDWLLSFDGANWSNTPLQDSDIRLRVHPPSAVLSVS